MNTKTLIVAIVLSTLSIHNSNAQDFDFGSDFESDSDYDYDFIPASESETAIAQARLIPLNQNFVPDQFAYRLWAQVRTGGNRCQARGVEIELRQQQVGQVIEIVAVVTYPDDYYGRFCTLEYQPQYKWAYIDVSGFLSDVNTLVIKNLGGYGNDYSVELR